MLDADFWNNFYTDYLKNGKDFPWRQSDFVNKSKEVISDILPLSQRKKLLDYGCGTGTYIDLFIEKGYEVTIADISSIAIDKCKELYGEKISSYLLGDSPDNINGKYDVVICWGMMHHIEPKNMNTFIEKFYELLNDSGILIISGWDKDNGRYINSNGISNNTHFETWAINDMQNKFENYFTIIKNEKFSFNNVEIDDNNFRYYVCKKIDNLELFEKDLQDYIKKCDNISFAQVLYYKIKDNIEKARCDRDKSYVIYQSQEDMAYTLSEVLTDSELKYAPKVSLSNIMYNTIKDKKNIFFYSSKDSKEKFEIEKDHSTIKIYNIPIIPIEKNQSNKNETKDENNWKKKSLGERLNIPDFKKRFNIPDFGKLLDIPDFGKQRLEIEDICELLGIPDFGKQRLDKDEPDIPDICERLGIDIASVNFVENYNKKKCDFDKLKPTEYDKESEELKQLIKFFYYTFHSKTEDRYVYYFINPIFKIRGVRIGDGGLLLYCKKFLPEDDINKIELLFTKWASALSIKSYSNIFRQESIKSAIAAIMSRNMSHNLGSHVMAYLKQHLHSVEDIGSKNTLIDLLPKFENWNNQAPKAKDLLKINNDDKKYIEMPFLVGLGRFISYLQERQDFIATICTNYIPYFSSVNFKDFIYDELNLDLRYERHKEQLVGKGLQPHNILLNFIANSEGLSRLKNINMKTDNSNIVLKFNNFDGTDKEHSDLEKMRIIEFSLPGGIVGRQAFFSIVENIIRNAAKHGKREKNKNLELTIRIFEYKDIKDNAGWEDEYKNCKEIQNDDLYIITITDNLKNNGNAIDILKIAIDDKYIDIAGNLEDSYKGIKEMRISAAYLRGINIVDEEDYKKNKEKAPILQVKKTGNENENYLQYIFFVPKCKKIAFVYNFLKENEDILNDCNENLKEVHCKLYNVTNFKEETNLNYDFILANDDNVYNEILPISHSRILSLNFSDKLKEKFASLLTPKDYKEDKIKPIDKYLTDLYSKLKSVKGIDIITIIDGTVTYNKECKRIKYFQNDNAIKNETYYKYVYRSHHDNESNFNEFYDTYKNTEFIESITGGNSTDRLIRKENLNDLWFYRHAIAMNTRIAIFDERLFTKITGIEQFDLEKQSGKNDWWEDILGRYKETDDKHQLKNAIKELLDEFKKKTNTNTTFKDRETRIINELEVSDNNFQMLKEKCAKLLKMQVPQETKNHKAIVFHQKKIDFFTCVYDIDSESFNLWGYKTATNKNNKYLAIYENLGEIKKAGESITININQNLRLFDYISIHQGLLDKIYDKFGIPKANKYEKDNKGRFNVTTEIFKKFIDEKYKPIKDFLPRFIVHSGRSKPSFNDMPQKQPFIQYSAIESAVMDCKYTLVDLLDHAHYEE